MHYQICFAMNIDDFFPMISLQPQSISIFPPAKVMCQLM